MKNRGKINKLILICNTRIWVFYLFAYFVEKKQKSIVIIRCFFKILSRLINMTTNPVRS
jgi:hypothetical protein